jgi:hypothetical protein
LNPLSGENNRFIKRGITVKKHLGIILMVCVVLIGLTISTHAQNAPAAIPVDVPGTNIIFMNLRVPIGNLDLYASRELIWERIFQALSPGLEEGNPLNGESVWVDQPKYGNPKIYIDEVMIIEVDSKHASLNRTTAAKLAQLWAKNLALALDKWAEINRRIV